MVHFTHTENAEYLAVKATGSLTFEDHAVARSLLEVAGTSSSDSIMLDIETLKAIDSAGVGILLFLNDHIRKLGKTFTIRKPAGTVKKVIELAKLRDAITIED